jgi:deoxyribodipyrimidine photo-lyase
MSSSPIDFVYFWFRRDLRLEDNKGLAEALKSGYPVKPLFIFDAQILSKLDNANDRRVSFIHSTLFNIKTHLGQAGSDLWTYYGEPEKIWATLLNEEGCKGIFTNRDYEPYAIKRDNDISDMALSKGKIFSSWKDQVIFEKNEIVKDDGTPYTVYTPYSKKWKLKFQSAFANGAKSEIAMHNFFKGNASEMPSLESMGFQKVQFDIPSTELANSTLMKYGELRDIPSASGTSRMGLHLRFGTVSVRELIRKSLNTSEKYLNELIWREFYQQILWHFPRVTHESFKPQYDRIEWRNNEDEFEKWCQGNTGYPIVDAGMRELLHTGHMHNRVRMVVASFLTKHLLIDWRWGEAWFAKHLLDFDLASNNGGWQWAAGCGVDAAPYFRVFNPTLQTQKFDPQLLYIRRWVPEFNTFNYAKPMVDHDFARKRCLDIYKKALGAQES